jgi:outer membrane protein assembly factor BamB
MNGDRFLPHGHLDNAATQLGRFWDAVVAGDTATTDVAPEFADYAAIVRRLHAEPGPPAPAAVHDGVRALFEANPAWWQGATVPVTVDPALLSSNGHGAHPVMAPDVTTAPRPRPIRRLWPVVELIGVAAAILALLYVAFGRDQKAEQPTPTTVPTAVVTPTAPVTPTVAAAAVGDWPMLGGGPSRSAGGDRSIPATAPVARWSTSLAPNIRFPVAAGDAVYVTDGGTLFALDAATGAERWRFDLGVAPSVAGANPPAVVAGVVYVASVDGTIYAIEAATGQERWHDATGEKITTAVAVAQGTVFAGTVDGSLYALDATNGEHRWSAATGSVTASSPVVADGRVIVAAAPNQLLALDAKSGTKLWGKVISTDMRSVAVGGGIAVVGSRPAGLAYLVALDTATGDLRWRNTMAPVLPPAIGDGTVYTNSGDGVDALDAGTGQQRWQFAATLSVVQIAIAGDAVILCRADGDVIALDAATGQRRWQIATGDGATGAAVGAGVIYAAHKDGTIAAYG